VRQRTGLFPLPLSQRLQGRTGGGDEGTPKAGLSLARGTIRRG